MARRYASKSASDAKAQQSAPKTKISPADAMKAIVQAVEGLEGRAALSHYPSRRIWAGRLHAVLQSQLFATEELLRLISQKGSQRETAADTILFAPVIPVFIKQMRFVLAKLLEDAPPLAHYEMGDKDISKSIMDFNRLIGSSRQFVDSCVQTAYLLTELSPSIFNQSVLKSLSSFRKLAPDSLQVPFMTEELSQLVGAFETDKHQTFAAKGAPKYRDMVQTLVQKLPMTFIKEPAMFLDDIFRFTSESLHTGFFSSLIVGKGGDEVYMGSSEGVFFPSTENYVEVQFLCLKACCLVLGDVYIKAFAQASVALYKPNVSSKLSEISAGVTEACRTAFAGTGHEGHIWISNDALIAKKPIRIKCACQNWFTWEPPHHIFDLYCKVCGSIIKIIRMREPFGYCILPAGPCDVFGSLEPTIDDLSESLRDRLYALWNEFSTVAVPLTRPPFVPVLLVDDIANFAIRMPEPSHLQTYTFVSGRALQSREGITVVCNCRFMSVCFPKVGQILEHMVCWACSAPIKLMGLDGDGGYLFGSKDGEPILIDVQSSAAIPSWRLSSHERTTILAKAPRS